MTEEKELTISDKIEMMCDLDYENHEAFPYKINMEFLQRNAAQESYREKLVSYFQMAPLIRKTVELEKADYILYEHPFARIEDFSPYVLEDLEEIDKRRKPGAEVIIVGKAVNIQKEIAGKYDNITYVPSHYAEYIGKRFGLDIKDEYFVYDNIKRRLNIWPVNGCMNNCGFCRRSYMDIPFESLPLEKIKERLDWFKKNHPEQLKVISLRAENLTQYGIDIYGKPMLHKIIELLDSYDEIKNIKLSIGMCIGDITPEILAAICNCKKISRIALNLEAGSNRLLNVIGKKHKRETAIEICSDIRKAHPNIYISTTVMVGLPTEELEDILELADLILKCNVNQVLCNYYGHCSKNPLDIYPQLNERVRELHLSYLIRLLKRNFNNDFVLSMNHEVIENRSKRKNVRKYEELMNDQKLSFAKLHRVVNERFLGNDISFRDNNRFAPHSEEIESNLKRVLEARRVTMQNDKTYRK